MLEQCGIQWILFTFLEFAQKLFIVEDYSQYT